MRLGLVNRYKLTLRSLKFLSAVDFPAQEPAVCVLTKRNGAPPDVKASYRVTKMDESLGLVIGMSIITSIDGVPYTDLQGDEVQEQDLLKTVVGFMEAGAPTDTNHNREADGRVVLSWVFDAETNKAMDVTARKHGWATGLKVSPETFAKFKSGEYTGFSIDGTGERVPVDKSAGRAVKAMLYTNEVDGHQHQIDCYEGGGFYVGYATAAGADNSHSHGIVFEDGKLTILADSGHSHELAEGQAGVAVVPADAVVIVAARAPAASKSTPQKTPAKMAAHPEKSTMNDLETLKATIADLTKRAERLDRIANMSGAYKTHFDMLKGEDAEAFLAKSNAERDTIVKAALDADAPIWTGEVTKVAVRTRDGDLALQLAKQNEANAVLLAKREDEIEKAEVRSIAKAHLGKLTGDDATHDLIVRSLRKSGAAQADIDKALTAIKGWNEIAASKGKAPGAGGTDPEPADTLEAFNAGVKSYAEKHKIADEGEALVKFLGTTEGQTLKRKYDATRAYGKHLA